MPHLDLRELPELVQLRLCGVVAALISLSATELVTTANIDRSACVQSPQRSQSQRSPAEAKAAHTIATRTALRGQERGGPDHTLNILVQLLRVGVVLNTWAGHENAA